MNDIATLPRGKTPLTVPNELSVPPSDLETERCVLGSAMLDSSVIDSVQGILKEPAAFHGPSHRVIWSAMLSMHESGADIDAVTLRHELEQRGQLVDAGGTTALRHLMETVPHAAHAEHYAGIVRDLFNRRRTAEIGREITRQSLTPGADAAEIIVRAETSFRSLSESQSPRRSFAGLDAAELETYSTQEPDWLVQELFTSDEPLLVGARSKGCKTLQLVDLAVALASGTSWMNTFNVPKPRMVLFISGETNNRRMSRHIDRACRVRGLSFQDIEGMVRVEAVDFPNLPSPDDLRAIERTVKRHGIEVVILDPLYRGMAGVDAAQLSEMGGAIKNFQAACSPATLILSHHVVKSAAREYGNPPSLEDMTGAGIAESCGQWWLVGRNERYEWNGMHDLCVSYGGREGQAGGKRIVFDERAWTFDVQNLSDFIASEDDERREQQAAAKAEVEARKLSQSRAKILAACRNVKVPQSRTRISETSGQTRQAMGAAFAELVQQMVLVQRPYRDSANRVQTEGYILAEYTPEYDTQWASTGMPEDAGT